MSVYVVAEDGRGSASKNGSGCSLPRARMIAGPPVGAVVHHRDALGHHGRATGEQEQLAEVVRLDQRAALDPREPDRPTAPRIVEIAVADVLDHERDLVVREHEVAVLPGLEAGRTSGRLAAAMRPARASVGPAPSGSGRARLAVADAPRERHTVGANDDVVRPVVAGPAQQVDVVPRVEIAAQLVRELERVRVGVDPVRLDLTAALAPRRPSACTDR